MNVEGQTWLNAGIGEGSCEWKGGNSLMVVFFTNRRKDRSKLGFSEVIDFVNYMVKMRFSRKKNEKSRHPLTFR